MEYKDYKHRIVNVKLVETRKLFEEFISLAHKIEDKVGYDEDFGEIVNKIQKYEIKIKK